MIQIPSSLEVTAITNAANAVITVVVNPVNESKTYIEGQLIKLNIPYGYGMQQANGMTAQIVSVSGLTITVDIDSRLFDPFSVPASGQKPASISPMGSRNLQLSNTTAQVPFQSLNNQGN